MLKLFVFLFILSFFYSINIDGVEIKKISILKLFVLLFFSSFFYSVNIDGVEIKNLEVAIKKMKEDTNGLLSSEDDLRYCIDFIQKFLEKQNQKLPNSYSDYITIFMQIINSYFDAETYFNDKVQCDDLICFEKVEIFFAKNKELAYKNALKYKEYLENKKNYDKFEDEVRKRLNSKMENNKEVSNNTSNENEIADKLKNIEDIKLNVLKYSVKKNNLPKSLFEKFYSKKESDIMIVEMNDFYVILFNFKIKQQIKNSSIKNDLIVDLFLN